MTRPVGAPDRRRSMYAALALAVAATAGCVNGPAVLTKHAEARHLAASLHVEFSQANEAAGRAVMADTDEATSAAAKEAQQASGEVDETVRQLQPLLESLGYKDEVGALELFVRKFDEYKKLDAEILPLAVENTNLKAQRLSFGTGQEAANAVFTALAAAAAGSPQSIQAASEAARCRAAILTIQVIQARHIAETDEAAMTRMEGEMATAGRLATASLEHLRQLLPAAGETLAEGVAAFDRFMAVNREIVELSRRNSNVRSLALTLGKKRVVSAECEDLLRTLEETLGRHAFGATR